MWSSKTIQCSVIQNTYIVLIQEIIVNIWKVKYFVTCKLYNTTHKQFTPYFHFILKKKKNYFQYEVHEKNNELPKMKVQIFVLTVNKE